MPDTAAGPVRPAPFGLPLVLSLDLAPQTAFLAFRDDPHVAWLHSAGPAGPRSRFSTLAIDPFDVITTSPFDRLEEAMRRFAEPAAQVPAPFTGGAVGFLGYEEGAALHGVPRHHGPPGIPGASIGLYDLVLAFDRASGRAWLVSSGLPETTPATRAARAAARVRYVLDRLARSRPADRLADAPALPRLAWRAEAARATHEARVARAIAYTEAGDIYQANVTAAFHAARPPGLHAAETFLALAAASPAPFSAYVAAGPGTAVASVSPERFLSLDASGYLEARPIKGTSPRHADPGQDAALRRALLASGKDRAENLMIVDLLRHDVSQVAQVGSVHVAELAAAESFASVHHLVSSVRGRLRPDATAVDLLRAAFPPGSVTGAPKRRAMQVIHELEPAARGPYCGAVFWMGWDGAMDSSVAIRTATLTPDRVTLQAGGGIVADSTPAAEHEEVMVKAGPLLAALGELA